MQATLTMIKKREFKDKTPKNKKKYKKIQKSKKNKKTIQNKTIICDESSLWV